VKRIKSDLDGAVADYSRAIEIDPNYRDAYINRGNARSEKGDPDGAVADYSRAIEIDPKFAVAYSNRGNVFQAKGQFDQAVADFNDAMKRNTKDEYACLRLLIATWLAKGDTGGATATLRRHIEANNSDDWVRTISKYYLGIDNLNEQAVLAKARNGKDGKEVGERLCEAYYYLGVKRLVAGNRKGAVEYFTLSVETDVKSFQEYNASKAMLTLMKEGKIAGTE
jgi:lipoprotein NlpI